MSDAALTAPVHELAYAKLNLVLHVGNAREDGLHPICSIFASIDLYDDVHLERAEHDSVECPGVDGPNLAEAALAAFRRRVPDLPPLRIVIEKRIPIAAGLGGGSADAAAVLRGANHIAGDPLTSDELRGGIVRLLGAPRLVGMRRRGESERRADSGLRDLRPFIEDVEVLEVDEAKATARLRMLLRLDPSGAGRPEDVVRALDLPLRTVRAARVRLLFVDTPPIAR